VRCTPAAGCRRVVLVQGVDFGWRLEDVILKGKGVGFDSNKTPAHLEIAGRSPGTVEKLDVADLFQ
jgi:hypothetical protein